MPLKTLTLLLGLSLSAAALAQQPAESRYGDAPPIVLTLFLHDQLSLQERASIGPDYLGWFIKELETVSARRVEIITVSHQPGYTDFSYRLDNLDESISQWSRQISRYIRERNLPDDSRRHKYILVTRNPIDSNTLGIAYVKRRVALASLRSYNTIAHEMGHLLGASHENGSIRFAYGLPCHTIMKDSPLPACGYFSEENRQAIRDYLKDS